MSTLIEIAIATLAVTALLWFLRKMFRRPPEEDNDPGDYAEVTAPLPRGPRHLASRAKVEEPDED